MLGPSSECVHCRVSDLEFGQAGRVGSALQCLTGFGVTARVAVRAGWAAFLTVRRAFFRGFGANNRQSSPML